MQGVAKGGMWTTPLLPDGIPEIDADLMSLQR